MLIASGYDPHSGPFCWSGQLLLLVRTADPTSIYTVSDSQHVPAYSLPVTVGVRFIHLPAE